MSLYLWWIRFLLPNCPYGCISFPKWTLTSHRLLYRLMWKGFRKGLNNGHTGLSCDHSIRNGNTRKRWLLFNYAPMVTVGRYNWVFRTLYHEKGHHRFLLFHFCCLILNLKLHGKKLIVVGKYVLDACRGRMPESSALHFL